MNLHYFFITRFAQNQREPLTSEIDCMLGRKKRKPGIQHLTVRNTGWRQYQQHLKLRAEKQRSLRRIPQYILILVVLAAVIKGGFVLVEWRAFRTQTETAESELPEIETMDQPSLRALVGSHSFHNLTENNFTLKAGIKSYDINTSIDPDLQNSILGSLDTKWAQEIGIVVLEPDTGRIIAMVSHDSNPETNNCLRSTFPAASLFKIITAAAAVETCAFTENTRLEFNGGNVSLYKSQLTDRINKYTNYTDLKDAFAGSINPVFGKIGRDKLGKTVLEKYADAFAFNGSLEFDLPLEESIIRISDDPYNWAEIASGFNRVTSISPLHGAVLAATAVSGGKIISPTIIDSVSSDSGVVYHRKARVLSEAVKPSTAKRLKTLMAATVTQGTARGAFQNMKRDPILSELLIGGKTGSINNNPLQIKYDWFAGFAEDKRSGKKIAACILVAHREYIGTRAATYFRNIARQYFMQLSDTSRTPS